MKPLAPALTDRPALDRQRDRAVRNGSDAFFLHDLAIDEIKERLAMVNRSFTRAAIVTGHPSIWSAVVPGATVVADTDALDLAPSSFDLVIHAMSLHWAEDPVGQIVQCQRALKPDGLFLACLFGGQTLNELRTVLAEAEIACRGGLSPRIVPMAEIRDLGGLIQRAGLNLPVADSISQTVTYGDVVRLMHDLRNMGEGNALASRARTGLSKELMARTHGLYAEHFTADDGRLKATFEIIFLSGWSPHPDQQKPMRPGSASHSLASVLDDLKSTGE